MRDYPMDVDPQALVKQLRAQPLNTTFAWQVKAARSVYGAQLQWAFSAADVAAALEEPLEFYAERDQVYIADRVRSCIHWQAGKL